MIALALALALAGDARAAELSDADEHLAEVLSAWVVATCGADTVEVSWMGVRAELLPTFDEARFSGEPCSPRPSVRLDLLAGGERIAYRNLWPRLLVTPSADQGDEVVLRVRRGGLVVEAPGRLLADAAVGGPARVANPATEAVLLGTLTDANTVELR